MVKYVEVWRHRYLCIACHEQILNGTKNKQRKIEENLIKIRIKSMFKAKGS